MESAKMTRAERRWVITELFSFFFFATAPENGHDDNEEVQEDDDDDGGDDDKEEYLELEVEEQDKAGAYSSHCAPRFILSHIFHHFFFNCV